jgi:hypothetical protein
VKRACLGVFSFVFWIWIWIYRLIYVLFLEARIRHGCFFPFFFFLYSEKDSFLALALTHPHRFEHIIFHIATIRLHIAHLFCGSISLSVAVSTYNRIGIFFRMDNRMVCLLWPDCGMVSYDELGAA